jgi:hypothetical protein
VRERGFIDPTGFICCPVSCSAYTRNYTEHSGEDMVGRPTILSTSFHHWSAGKRYGMK